MGRSEFAKELRGMSFEEVERILSDKKTTIMRLRNEAKGDDFKNTAEWIKTKKDIARCMGILSEKKVEEIKEECISTGKQLPKFLRKKLPRTARVSITKETLKRHAQQKHTLKRKIVVFTP